MPSDLNIARSVSLLSIGDIAEKAGFSEDTVIPYGRYMAKIDQRPYQALPQKGRLVLVTAVNPTPAGEGKTTVSIALADGMRRNGKNAMLALREPSLGPVFGMKGGAAGGGYAQIAPMENINLHFTGDLHAITAANNLLCAMIDNHIRQGNVLGLDPRRICFRHCLDVNDRQLRQIVQGLGGPSNGTPREDGFDITAASEIMAVFCMARDLKDLQDRLGAIVIGRRADGTAVTAGELGAAGAMAALLRDAFFPNLVQTLEHTPCLVHGGPFANIAHGCNSVAATSLALRMSDYTVTEAGFGADLGAEKFLDIKCRAAGLWPNAIVLVATLRALKCHGGASKGEYDMPNTRALQEGAENLFTHISNIRDVWHTPVIVALNRFTSDSEEETALLGKMLDRAGVPWSLCSGWADGGEGARNLADMVCSAADANPSPVSSYTYADDLSLQEKIEVIAKKIYHAEKISFSQQALKDLRQLEKEGRGGCPVCIAKSQYFLWKDPADGDAPCFTVRSVRLSAGAGFAVAFAGSIIAMPGLPKAPAALQIGVDDNGDIYGVF